MNELAALLVFAFAGSVSPGPNNAVLWASGLQFGFRRTVPHVVGTAIGIGTLVVGVAAGIGALVNQVPTVELVLKIVGSAYLLVIAFLVVGSSAMGRANVARPLTVRQAVAFQCLNPKAWIFAVAAVGTFLPPGLHRVVGMAAIDGIITIIVLCSSTIWAIGGSVLGGLVTDERRRRAVNLVLGLVLVAAVGLLWI